VFVMRRAEGGEPGQIDLYQLDARDASALVLADDFTLRPRDIIYVTAAPVARWNRVIQQLLPTAQGVFYGTSAYDDVRDN
jgi:polysaccharide export outer membrane protein